MAGSDQYNSLKRMEKADGKELYQNRSNVINKNSDLGLSTEGNISSLVEK